MRRHVPSVILSVLGLVALLALPAFAGDPPAVRGDVASLGDRVIDAPADDVEALARAVASLDLAEARALVEQLRARFAAAEDGGAGARPWPRMTPLDLGGDEDELPPVDPDAPIVDVTTRILDVDAALLPQLLALGKPADGATLWLDQEASSKLDELIKKHAKGLTVVTAPRLATYDGQRANISILNQIAYVQDYEVEISNDVSVADPIIGTLNEGLVVDLRPHVAADDKAITLEVSVTEAEVNRPIPEIQVAAGPSTVTLQVPEMHVRQMRSTVTLADGHAAMLVGEGNSPEGGAATRRVVIVRAGLAR
ncbi:MAG: hypothetical protein AB7T63_02205 [Planctomycetota bacterium]